jgi:hypothetical protein
MKSKLVSIARTNLLYMSVIIANTKEPLYAQSSSVGGQALGLYAVAVDEATAGRDTVSSTATTGFLKLGNQGNANSGLSNATGILNGYKPGDAAWRANYIRVDQGLNTRNIPNTQTIDAELNETQYIVEIDNRLGSLVATNATATPGKISFIDDDNIASYYLSLATDGDWVKNITTPNASSIQGPCGTSLEFKILASTELQTSTYLFEKLGSTGPQPQNFADANCSVRYIDTIIKITGATTGYRIDLPVRFIKMTTT